MESIKCGTRRKSLILLLLFLCLSIALLATEAAGTQEVKKPPIDWFSLLLLIGYLGGTIVILPIVIYTNLNEGLKAIAPSGTALPEDLNLTEEERNNRAFTIVKKMEGKLTKFTDEEGSERVIINHGWQARFVKKSLDYINTRLMPTDPDILEAVTSHAEHYKARVKRIFGGSYLIIACSVGVGIFITYQSMWTFLILHVLGLVLYILASKIPTYAVERRAKRVSGGGILAGVFAGLFAGAATKHYIKHGSGPWERDGSAELTNSLGMLAFMVILAMIVGFFTAFLGVVNFLINYSTSFLTPLAKADEKWFEKTFAK